MFRDLTMIFAVLISLFSVGFGVYKNVQASNAKGFAYEQAYRVIGKVQEANIPSAAKASIIDAALGALSTPPPVIDLSRSSAGTIAPQVCTDGQKASCARLATDLAGANAACARSKGASDDCTKAEQMKSGIIEQGCFACFAQ